MSWKKLNIYPFKCIAGETQESDTYVIQLQSQGCFHPGYGGVAVERRSAIAQKKKKMDPLEVKSAIYRLHMGKQNCAVFSWKKSRPTAQKRSKVLESSASSIADGLLNSIPFHKCASFLIVTTKENPEIFKFRCAIPADRKTSKRLTCNGMFAVC